ncbi:alpha/beta fold hydrolase [Solicola gregarius]|uniref:Alpha/beta hydrolase n=1 Tax=Solicola gregarius TaxID=2908642 RepID=A0AA46YP54_9ACTN|nr:alpha/beta hydrolase [Solicola gregarius]UYM07288.1 alpha/beta hydrolase [Solicola gregarius]
MPNAHTDDGVDLYYEDTGSGDAIVFLHEFAGDHRSWEPQVRHLSRTYRCLVPAARGFPPSDVPSDPDLYSQQRAVADAIAVLDAAGVESAYVVGNSMGGFGALHLALSHPARVRGAVVAGCGYGAHPDKEAGFRTESGKIAEAFETEGSASMSQWYGLGPARVQYEAKDPRGHAEHVRVLSEHDPVGAANTMRGVQMERPSLYAMRDELARCEPPVLVIAGDEDDGVLETDLMLKRTIPRCGLAVLPRSGHVTNLEEPALFNALLDRFFAAVEHGRWGARDPRSLSGSTTGAK